jgi:hypothetical protein
MSGRASKTAGLLIAAMVGSACGLITPPLSVRQTAAGVEIDMRTLGEYQTSISRIRLSDVQRRVVWEVEAQGNVPQIFAVELHCGRNQVRIPEYNEYKVKTPASSDTFALAGNEDYTVEVWGVDKLMRARGYFRLEGCK